MPYWKVVVKWDESNRILSRQRFRRGCEDLIVLRYIIRLRSRVRSVHRWGTDRSTSLGRVAGGDGRRARWGVRRPFFSGLEAGALEVCIGEQDQGDVVVPPLPR